MCAVSTQYFLSDALSILLSSSVPVCSPHGPWFLQEHPPALAQVLHRLQWTPAPLWSTFWSYLCCFVVFACSSSILSPLFSQRWHQADWLSCVLRKVHWNKPCLPEGTPGIFSEATPGIFSEATTAAPTLQNPHHLHSVQLANPADLKSSFQYEGIYCNSATKTKIAVQLGVLCS